MFGKKPKPTTLNVHDGLPRGRPDETAEQYTAPNAQFASTAAVAKHLSYQPGQIFLGVVDGYLDVDPITGQTFVNGGQLIGVKDDRHLLTIGGNRAGKGRSCIIPNLLKYTHSVIAIDIKGELATLTSRERGTVLKQRIYVLDPFGISTLPPNIRRAGFNPLAGLNTETVIEAAARIADALVVASGKDVHWDESAKNFIEALIIHVVTDPYYAGRVHLGTVRDLLGEAGEDGRLKDEMLTNVAAGGIVVLGARDFFDRQAVERASVLSTARRHLKFLDYPEIRRVLERHDFNLADLKTAATTVYLCLPARHMGTCNRWLRLVINLGSQEMEKVNQPPATGGPVLFCMDEFASLGHMKSIEDAAGQMAGFGVKLWPILQDLTQLKALYQERWETFIGNAGIVQCFGANDLTTLEWISKRCGRTTVKVPRETPLSAEKARQEGVGAVTYTAEQHELLAVHEIAEQFSRADPQCRQLILRADGKPVILQRVFYDLHPFFRSPS
jgi:type IV secretion system protein VirD4